MIGLLRTRVARKVLAAGAVVLGGSTVVAPAAVAQSESIGGYQGSAQASAVHALYTPEGVLPIAAPVDFGAPDALATISGGPTLFARSSVADPGDLLANPDALLSQTEGYEPGTLPAYPYRATATSPGGEQFDESSPGGGFGARAEADGSSSRALAETPATSVSVLLEGASSRSTASTSFDGTSVTVEARTDVGETSLLGGLLRFEGLSTVANATSNGTSTEVSGVTELSRASVLGQPVTIDETGVHFDGEPEAVMPPFDQVEDGISLGGALDPVVDTLDPLDEAFALLFGDGADNLNEALETYGITVTAPGAVELDGDSSGVYATTGLRVQIRFSPTSYPLLIELLDAVPTPESPIPGAPSLADAITLAKANELAILDIGRTRVELSASTLPAFAPSPAPPVTPPVSSSGGSADLGLGPALAPPQPPPALDPSSSVLDPTPSVSTVTPLPLASGLGALAFLVLLGLPVVGDRMALAARRLLYPPSEVVCVREI